MTDQPDQAGPDNGASSLISLQQQQQVQYWTTRLGVSRNQLLQAIDAVGDSAPQVEAWLKYQGQLTA
ncbi:MAG: DUF3606 domain-containing protein [Pseudoxanthomonas sp.]